MTNDTLWTLDAAFRVQVNELDRPQCLGNFHGHCIRIQTKRIAGTIDPDGRNDGNNVVFEHGLQQDGIHPLNLPGEQVIDSAKDTGRVRNDGIRIGGTQVVCRKSLQNFVSDSVGGRDRDVERVAIGNPRAEQVGRDGLDEFGIASDLMGGSMNEGNPDAQATKERNIEEQRRGSYRPQ